MIATLEHHHRVPAGHRAGGRQRHGVALGARIGEAHPLDRREAGADERRQPLLAGAGGAEGHPGVQRPQHRLAEHRVRVAVEPGGEIAGEVGVGVAVDVGQGRARRLLHGEREGRVEHARPRIAAGQAGARPFELCPALRIGRDVAGRPLRDGAFEVEIPAARSGSRRHRRAPRSLDRRNITAEPRASQAAPPRCASIWRPDESGVRSVRVEEPSPQGKCLLWNMISPMKPGRSVRRRCFPGS